MSYPSKPQSHSYTTGLQNESTKSHKDDPFFLYVPHAYVHNPRYACPDIFEQAESDVNRATVDILPSLARLIRADIPTDRTIDGKDALDVLLGKPGAKAPHKILYPSVAKSKSRTGLQARLFTYEQARLFTYETVFDLVFANLTKCEICKPHQKDIDAQQKTGLETRPTPFFCNYGVYYKIDRIRRERGHDRNRRCALRRLRSHQRRSHFFRATVPRHPAPSSRRSRNPPPRPGSS